MLLTSLFSCWLAFGLSAASVLPLNPQLVSNSVRRGSPSSGSGKPHHSGCENGPESRDCWSGGFSIDTDSEEEWPNTGKTVKYSFEVTEKTLSPDGTPRDMIVVNGQYPGPTIFADWGDMVQIDVKNSLKNNGTSFHWHGINQYNTNTQDGANGITECPIPPGATRRYLWRATQHGTTWYHSHHASQYGDGVLGAIQINGPAAVDYDIDLGVLPITDFYYHSMYILGRAASGAAPIPGSPPGPPTADNGLINGTNVNSAGGGHFANVSLIPGKKYRLRLVNTAVDNHFQVSLDKHIFTVIQSDFVPIVPYDTTWLFVGIGQRYDVVFTASQKPANYWFRAEVQAGCGSNAMSGNIKAIFNYKGVVLGNPTSKPAVNFTNSCEDEKSLVPYVPKDVPEREFRENYAAESLRETLTVDLSITPGNTFFWNINNNSLVVDWEQPTLKYVADHNTSYRNQKELGIVELPNADCWTFWIIQNTNGIPHPIHLHGHDFYILGSAAPPPTPPSNATPPAGPPGGPVSTFSAANISSLNFSNPPRRDVAMLPGSGYLVIAFETNNPGAWLLHCHIAWHVAEGLAVQFLERAREIESRMSLSSISDTCAAWRKWYDNRPPIEHESGL